MPPPLSVGLEMLRGLLLDSRERMKFAELFIAHKGRHRLKHLREFGRHTKKRRGRRVRCWFAHRVILTFRR
jgi:hypothetical protein